MLSFDYHNLFVKFRTPLLILLVGSILALAGLLIYKYNIFSGTKVEVLGLENNSNQVSGTPSTIRDFVVEISGEVLKPGVYKLSDGSRIDDLLTIAGGLSPKADKTWTDKYLNRAAKITDGQKIYIPAIGQQSEILSAKSTVRDQSISSINSVTGSNLININTASAEKLDSLPGIGPVYAQNIIEHRPYSSVDELVSKAAIKQSLFNKIKDLVSVY